MSRDLIFGAIEGYTLAQLELFFRSLRATSYDGDVVIFYRRIETSTLAALRQYDVRLIPVRGRGIRNPITKRSYLGDGRLGWLLRGVPKMIGLLQVRPSARIRLMVAFAEHFFHIANTRFILAYAFLKSCRQQYRHIMMSDIRDVCFQANPFEFPEVEQLCVFQEDPSVTINQCQNYRDWIRCAFGEQEVERFGDERLSCCAITIGPAAEMEHYLYLMSRFMCENTTQEPYRFGLDSAVHNHLLFHHLFKEVRRCENLQGSVLTMGGMSPDQIIINESGAIVSESGSIVNTLHQFDRHPSVLHSVMLKWHASQK